MTTIEVRYRLRLVLAGGAVTLLLGALLVLLLARGAGADHEPIHAVPLTTPGHNQFTDDVAVQVRDKPARRATEVVNLRDASNLAVFQFTIQPGAWFPWHTHPGPVLAAVAQGELVFIYADDCRPRRYEQGTAFVDPGLVHTAYNPSDTETVVVATVLGVAEGAPAATPFDAASATAHNEACDTPAPVPGGDEGPGAVHDH